MPLILTYNKSSIEPCRRLIIFQACMRFEGGGGGGGLKGIRDGVFSLIEQNENKETEYSYGSLLPLLDQGNDCLLWRFE